MEAKGDCYWAASNFMMNKNIRGEGERYTLVHGEVAGQGQLEGTNFGHAWIVDNKTGNVIDKSNGRNIVVPLGLYYAIGHIHEIDNFYEYDYSEYASKVMAAGHHGPWDLETSTGL